MKRISLLLSVLFFSLCALAQFPGGGGGNQAAQNIGHIYGKVVDSAGKPVADASVILLQNKFDSVSKKRKDVLFKGLATKVNGEFSFEELPLFGGLKLKISASGFKPYEQVIAFQMKMPAGGNSSSPAQPANAMAGASNMLNAFDKDLGDIRL